MRALVLIAMLCALQPLALAPLRRACQGGRPATRLLGARSAPNAAEQAAIFGKRLLYADNHVLCVDKPAGVLSQGDRTGDPHIGDFAKAWVGAERGTRYASPVHRLDRPVSGCLLVAASSKAATRLSASLRDGVVDKRYLALVTAEAGAPHLDVGAERHLIDAMRTDGGATARATAVEPLATLREAPTAAALAAVAVGPGRRIAYTKYVVLSRSGDFALLEVALGATGRRHQIRAALAARGAPIAGDRKYGPRNNRRDGQRSLRFIGLHAASVVAPHPVADRPAVTAVAPLPAAWRKTYPPAIAAAADAYLATAPRASH